MSRTGQARRTMISKHITTKVQNDDYGRLANYVRDAHNHHVDRTAEYIADVEHQGEKVLYCWYCGCDADDYEMAIREVLATQSCNTRSCKEKTYHIVVSFRPEDEAKLTEAHFHEIESTFADALGFTDYQRHCGVHKNTGHLHLHIAYNMIHPTKFIRHEPFRDYVTRDRVCRELERRFELQVDNGRTHDTPVRGNDKARIIEAHTGQQSFDGYAQERQDAIGAGIAQATCWEDVHRALAQYGLEIRLRGNGCIIQDRHDTRGNRRIKASSLSRELSKSALEARFGVFMPTSLTASELETLEQERFEARPLQRGPERGELYAEYQAGIEQRKVRLESIRQEKEQREQVTQNRWDTERQRAADLPLTRADRTKILRTLRGHELSEQEGIRREIEAQRRTVREDVPFWNWNGFLKLKAEAGSEMALAILRSRDQEMAPEQTDAPVISTTPASVQPALRAQPENLRALREHWKQQRMEIRQKGELTRNDRQQLLAVSRMHQLVAEDHLKQTSQGNGPEGFTWRVDSRGTVLFTLPGGGLVRDNGTVLTFSAHDPKARAVAERLAKLKFGRTFSREGNRFYRKQVLRKEQERKKEIKQQTPALGR